VRQRAQSLYGQQTEHCGVRLEVGRPPGGVVEKPGQLDSTRQLIPEQQATAEQHRLEWSLQRLREY